MAVLEAMRLLTSFHHTADVYAVTTVQEEVGLRGAMVSAYGIVPDVAIAVDVGFGAEPGLPEDDVIAMGKGPAIALGANVHPRLHELLVRTARLNGIPHQIEPIPAGSGTRRVGHASRTKRYSYCGRLYPPSVHAFQRRSGGH